MFRKIVSKVKSTSQGSRGCPNSFLLDTQNSKTAMFLHFDFTRLGNIPQTYFSVRDKFCSSAVLGKRFHVLLDQTNFWTFRALVGLMGRADDLSLMTSTFLQVCQSSGATSRSPALQATFTGTSLVKKVCRRTGAMWDRRKQQSFYVQYPQLRSQLQIKIFCSHCKISALLAFSHTIKTRMGQLCQRNSWDRQCRVYTSICH